MEILMFLLASFSQCLMGILPFVVAAIVASLVLRRDDIKVYLYAMAGLAIIAFLIWGTFLLAKLLSVPIGLVDL
jgi:hypothetical protein